MNVVKSKQAFLLDAQAVMNEIRMDMRTKPNRGERARFDRAIRHAEAAGAMTNAAFEQRFTRRRVQRPPTGRYYADVIGR